MTRETPPDLTAKLEELLSAERQALLAGNTEALVALLPAKERLIADFGEQAAQEELVKMQNRVLRNQVLLDQAMAGLKAAANRLAELRKVREGLQTYDKSGRKTSLGALSARKLERRA